MNTLTISLDSVIEMNDEQFFRLCQKNRDLRFERNAKGDITIMAPAGSDTGMRNSDFNGYLWSWNQRKKLGFTFDSSTGFTLPNGAMRSPDAAWILKERWEALTPEQQSRFAPICPDFVMEDNGVRLGWLIDRKNRTVEVYSPGRSPEILEQPDTMSGEPDLPGFVLKLAKIW